MMTTRMAQFWTSVVGCTKSFDWASYMLSHVWVRLILIKLNIVTEKDRTHAYSLLVSHITTMPTVLISNFDLLLFKLSNRYTYEKSSKLIKIETFHQNQFYTLFSHLQLETEFFKFKTIGPKVCHPHSQVVQLDMIKSCFVKCVESCLRLNVLCQ